MNRLFPALAAVALGAALVVSAPLSAAAAAPVVSGLPSTTLTNDTTPVAPFPAVLVEDADSAAIDVQVTWDSTKGTLAGTGFDAAPGTLTATGVAPASVTSSLQALVFTPLPGLTADTLITISAIDDAATGSATTTVSVTAVALTPVHVGAIGTGIYGSAAVVTPTFPDGKDGVASDPTSCGSTTSTTDPVGVYIDAASCTGATANPGYVIVEVTGDVTVSPATLTVTASGGAANYGGTLPAVTASYSGFVDGNSGANVTGTICAVATPVTVPTTATNCSGASLANYTMSYVPGAVTVAPAPLLIAPSNANAVYGSTAAVTPTFTGFVNGETNTALSSQPFCQTSAGKTAHVGGHPNTAGCIGAVGANYVISYGPNATTTITPAPLTVTALGQSRLVGQANGTFGATYTGFVNGESAANLSGTLAFSTAASSSSPAGSYPVQPSGVSSTDYTITFKPGVVTVTPVAPTPSPTPTATPTATPSPTPTPTTSPTPSPTSSPLPNAGSGSDLDWLPWVLIPAGALFIGALIAILAWRRRAY